MLLDRWAAALVVGATMDADAMLGRAQAARARAKNFGCTRTTLSDDLAREHHLAYSDVPALAADVVALVERVRQLETHARVLLPELTGDWRFMRFSDAETVNAAVSLAVMLGIEIDAVGYENATPRAADPDAT